MTTEEFCDFDVNFSASCNSGEILQIIWADYGHMEIGKCIKVDIGFLGCKADVTGMLSGRCDGKQACEVSVLDQQFRDTEPCTPGINVYLRVSYACLKGRCFMISLHTCKSMNLVLQLDV